MYVVLMFLFGVFVPSFFFSRSSFVYVCVSYKIIARVNIVSIYVYTDVYYQMYTTILWFSSVKQCVRKITTCSSLNSGQLTSGRIIIAGSKEWKTPSPHKKKQNKRWEKRMNAERRRHFIVVEVAVSLVAAVIPFIS